MTALNPTFRSCLPHRTLQLVPWLTAAVLVACAAQGSCARPQAPKPKLEPVSALDVPRYMGRWYEIAALPNPFQKNCFGTYADYTAQADGSIVVLNRCHKNSLDGPLQGVEGKAWRPDASLPGALKVQFFWPFSGDYWVLALDEQYRWAVVGQPKRKYLWILSRTPTMEAATYASLCDRLAAWGYDKKDVHKTVQLPAPKDAAP